VRQQVRVNPHLTDACVCVSVSGLLFSVGVCCDLLIFLLNRCESLPNSPGEPHAVGGQAVRSGAARDHPGAAQHRGRGLRQAAPQAQRFARYGPM